MTAPSAKVVLDSISEAGVRLTTMEIVFHRFVLAEFNTHRSISKNSASSRAIPLAKQIERVRTDPAIPVSFPRERKGMQGGEELEGADRLTAEALWRRSSREAVEVASWMGVHGVHKSVANRPLEPFLWHTVVATAEDWAWDHFFALRCNPLAQPEIRVAAEAVRDAMAASTARTLPNGDWHLPYVDQSSFDDIVSFCRDDRSPVDIAKRMSVARCARVSYLTHDGARDIEKDLALYDRLVNPGDGPMHASPLEHVATPFEGPTWNPCERTAGNFRGWHQLRHEVER